jgi:hypothetical protein
VKSDKNWVAETVVTSGNFGTQYSISRTFFWINHSFLVVDGVCIDFDSFGTAPKSFSNNPVFNKK